MIKPLESPITTYPSDAQLTATDVMVAVVTGMLRCTRQPWLSLSFNQHIHSEDVAVAIATPSLPVHICNIGWECPHDSLGRVWVTPVVDNEEEEEEEEEANCILVMLLPRKHP